MTQDGDGFKHIRKLFPNKSEAKLKQGIFIGHEIHKLQRDELFKTRLSCKEVTAWEALVLVVKNFMGKHKATNYEEIVGKMLQAYKELGLKCH